MAPCPKWFNLSVSAKKKEKKLPKKSYAGFVLLQR